MHEEYIMILSDDLCIPESPKISDSYIIFLNCSYLVATVVTTELNFANTCII